MAYLRGQERFVYQQVLEQFEECFKVGLGWGSTPLPYGASVAPTIVEMTPDAKLEELAANTIGFSEGRMPNEREEEMGAASGGLVSTKHTFFIDIYGESLGMARALAADIRSIFLGRAPGSSRYSHLRDYGQPGAPVAAGHLLSFEDVEVDFPPVATSRHWAVVKLTCVHEYNG